MSALDSVKQEILEGLREEETPEIVAVIRNATSLYELWEIGLHHEEEFVREDAFFALRRIADRPPLDLLLPLLDERASVLDVLLSLYNIIPVLRPWMESELSVLLAWERKCKTPALLGALGFCLAVYRQVPPVYLKAETQRAIAEDCLTLGDAFGLAWISSFLVEPTRIVNHQKLGEDYLVEHSWFVNGAIDPALCESVLANDKILNRHELLPGIWGLTTAALRELVDTIVVRRFDGEAAEVGVATLEERVIYPKLARVVALTELRRRGEPVGLDELQRGIREILLAVVNSRSGVWNIPRLYIEVVFDCAGELDDRRRAELAGELGSPDISFALGDEDARPQLPPPYHWLWLMDPMRFRDRLVAHLQQPDARAKIDVVELDLVLFCPNGAQLAWSAICRGGSPDELGHAAFVIELACGTADHGWSKRIAEAQRVREALAGAAKRVAWVGLAAALTGMSMQLRDLRVSAEAVWLGMLWPIREHRAMYSAIGGWRVVRDAWLKQQWTSISAVQKPAAAAILLSPPRRRDNSDEGRRFEIGRVAREVYSVLIESLPDPDLSLHALRGAVVGAMAELLAADRWPGGEQALAVLRADGWGGGGERASGG